jgi:transposase-like protein
MSKLKFDRILAFRSQLPQLDQKERLGALDIAARLGVSSSCVNQWLRILGYRLNNHNGRTIYKHDHTGWEEKILPVYKATGYKAGKTAVALGMDKSVVYRWLANTGHLKPTYAPRDISTYKFQNYR